MEAKYTYGKVVWFGQHQHTHQNICHTCNRSPNHGFTSLGGTLRCKACFLTATRAIQRSPYYCVSLPSLATYTLDSQSQSSVSILQTCFSQGFASIRIHHNEFSIRGFIKSNLCGPVVENPPTCLPYPWQ